MIPSENNKSWISPVCQSLYSRYRIPLLSTIIFGLFSYMYAFTNKLVNYDELFYTFGKGERLSSGRWGLNLISYLLPDYSMPWFYGIITIAIFAISVCLIVEIFQMRSRILQAILGVSLVSNISLASNMLFLFTSACYALAFLFSVLSVYFITRENQKK